MTLEKQTSVAVEKYVSGNLLLGLQISDKIEKHSDWYAAGSGAALLLLVANVEKLGVRNQDAFRSAIWFLAASLGAAAIVKFFGYFASVYSISVPATKASIEQFKIDMAGYPLKPAFDLALAELRPRIRIPGSVLFLWGKVYAKRDPHFAAPTMCAAVVQYMACFNGIQILCILNAALRLAYSV